LARFLQYIKIAVCDYSMGVLPSELCKTFLAQFLQAIIFNKFHKNS